VHRRAADDTFEVAIKPRVEKGKNMRSIAKSALLGLSLISVACGGEDADLAGMREVGSGDPLAVADDGATLTVSREHSPIDADAPAVPSTDRFAAGETEYQIVQGPTGDLSLIGTANADVVMPHQTLLEENGQLTLLEIFLALAPDQEPSQALVDYHQVQSEVLGRDDHSIRQVAYSAPVREKTVSKADCESLALGLVNRMGYPVDTWTSWSNTGPSYFALTPWTLKGEALTMCNPNSHVVPFRFGWTYQGWDSWAFTGWGSLGVNQKTQIYGPVTGTKRAHRVDYANSPYWTVAHFGWAVGG